MAGSCEICGKNKVSGFKYSHSHIRSKRKWKPNLQKIRAVVKGEAVRIYVCTRCLRSGVVQRGR